MNGCLTLYKIEIQSRPLNFFDLCYATLYNIDNNQP